MSMPDHELWAAHEHGREHDAVIAARAENDRREIRQQQQEDAARRNTKQERKR